MICNEQLNGWRDFLEKRYPLFAHPGFIPFDPVSLPHQFSAKPDIEIAGFLTAILSWGNRKAILNAARQLMKRMDEAPADYIFNASDSDFRSLEGFVYRTFQPIDLLFFCRSLQRIYQHSGGLEQVFCDGFTADSSLGMIDSIAHFRKVFFDDAWLPARTTKHLPDVNKGAAAKRINMFLRWMVRPPVEGIDFGLWKLPPSALLCPLDVHSATIARQAGLLQRQQNDLKAVIELTSNLRLIDPLDPVRFDLVLFGEGVAHSGRFR